MYDVITIGSSLTDIFLQSHDFSLQSGSSGLLLCQRYGDKIELDGFQVLTGGGGSNTAVGFARAGFHTAIVTETGQDSLAQLILDDLHQEHVATNLVIQEKKEQSGGSVILIGHDGGRTVMVHRGAASMLDPYDIPQKMIHDTGWVHLSSIGGNQATLETIFAARPEGKTSWNPGKQELHLLAESQLPVDKLAVEVLFVNTQEWQMVQTVQSSLRARIPVIVITAGGAGGTVLFQNRELPYASAQVTSVDDTGAGDAFAVGFVTAYIHQQPIETCIQAGVTNAGSVIQQIGAKAGLLTKQEQHYV